MKNAMDIMLLNFVPEITNIHEMKKIAKITCLDRNSCAIKKFSVNMFNLLEISSGFSCAIKPFIV